MRFICPILPLVLFAVLMSGCGRHSDPKVGECSPTTEDTTSVVPSMPLYQEQNEDTIEITLDSNETVSVWTKPVGIPTHRIDAPKTDKRRKTVFKFEQLIGEWRSGTLHEKFLADSTGCVWDDSDDVLPSEAKYFKYNIKDNHLLTIFRLEFGAVVPDVSVIESCDSLHLVRRDGLGNRVVYDKVR